MNAPRLFDYIAPLTLDDLIRMAQDEDLGNPPRDITSDFWTNNSATTTMHLRSREHGLVCGLTLIDNVISVYQADIRVELHHADGDAIAPGDTLATFSGNTNDLLKIERTALNFCGYLSGIASETHRYANAIAHTNASICDTRKTLPGYRGLAKYAVACGGGSNHRMGLYDAMLVKDNHLAQFDANNLSAQLAAHITHAREAYSHLKFIMVEVDTLGQLETLLPVSGIDWFLLDNMCAETLAKAVEMRNNIAPAVKLEASGGITLETLVGKAESGVDRLSIGALTHSVRNLDLGFDSPNA